VTYQTTVDDLLSYERELTRHTETHQKRRRVWVRYTRGIAFAIGYAATTFFPYRPEATMLFLLTAIGVGILFALLLTPLLNDLYVPFLLSYNRRQLNKQTTWPRAVTLALHDTHIEQRSIQNKIHRTTPVPWTAIKHVNEDDTHRFLYYEKDEALTIPKIKDSITESEQREIDHFITRHVLSSRHT